MSDLAVQLRVTAGVHAGAAVTLPDDDSALRVGSALDNDVVLLDAPCACWVVRRQDGQWSWSSGAERPAILCAIDQGLRIGDFEVMVTAADAPWGAQPPQGWCWDGPWLSEPARLPANTAETLPGEVERQDPIWDAGNAIQAGSDTVPATPSTTGEEADPSRASPVPAQTSPWAPGATSRIRRAVWVGALALVGVGAAVAWHSFWPLDLASTAARPRQAVVGAVAPASGGLEREAGATVASPEILNDVRAQLAKVLSPQAGRVRVQAGAGGKVELLGVVASDEVSEEVVRAAARVTPHLKLTLLTSADLGFRLKALAPQFEPGLQAQAGELGDVVLSGTVEDLQSVSDAKALIHKEFPAVFEVKSDVMTAQQRAAMTQREAESKVPRVPTLPPLAAVVSGARPYVVLANGNKIQPGGVVGKLRLADIQAEAVIFEDERGARFQMRR